MSRFLLVSIFLCSCLANAQNILLNVYGFDGNDRGIGIETAHNGKDILIVGYTSEDSPVKEDLYIVRTDSLGNLIWEKVFKMKGAENAWSLQKTNDGNYVLAGFSKGLDSPYSDIILLKFDETGNQIWFKKYQERLNQYAWGVYVTLSDEIVIIGQTDVDSKKATTLIKMVNNEGDELWTKKIEGKYHNRAYSILEEDGNFFLQV